MADTESAKGQSRLTARAEETLAIELPVMEAALKRILASLDLHATPCCTCGMTVKRSYNDATAAEKFRGMLLKVQAYADRVAGRR